MYMNQIVTIRDRRQITIPSLFLNKFGLDVGDKLILKLESDKINIEPIRVKTVDLLSKIQQIVKNSSVSKKELQKSASEIRKKLVRQYLK